MTPPLPPDIVRLILTSIPSIPYLEALLLVRGAPETDWTAAEIARRLYINEKTAQQLLSELVDAHIAMTQPGEPVRYRYHPVNDELRRLIDQLADVYARHLIEVTHLIHSKTDRTAQQFADAFKWRKED